MSNEVDAFSGYYVYVKKIIFETHHVFATDENEAIDFYSDYGEIMNVEVETDEVVGVVLDERYADVNPA